MPLSIGLNAEKSFKKSLEFLNFNVKAASTYEQIHEHIDFHIDNGSLKFTVDVKAQKNTTHPTEDQLWIEFKNVLGHIGWLYGKSDCIAFEVDNFFYIVNRKKLINLCESKIDFNSRANHPADCLYKIYNRPTRKDLISKIKLIDVTENLKYLKIKKIV